MHTLIATHFIQWPLEFCFKRSRIFTTVCNQSMNLGLFSLLQVLHPEYCLVSLYVVVQMGFHCLPLYNNWNGCKANCCLIAECSCFNSCREWHVHSKWLWSVHIQVKTAFYCLHFTFRSPSYLLISRLEYHPYHSIGIIKTVFLKLLGPQLYMISFIFCAGSCVLTPRSISPHMSNKI